MEKLAAKWQDFYQNPRRPIYLKILLAINLLGSWVGFLWYKEHLHATPWYYWPFVPDSPLSTIFFSVMLVILLMRKSCPLVELLACVSVIKYGVWAAYVLTDYWLIGGTINLIDGLLWLSHLGMAAEGFIFIRQLFFTAQQGVMVWLWMYINDFMDYWVGLHPYLPDPQQWERVMVFTIGLSTVLGIFVSRKWRKMTRQPGY